MKFWKLARTMEADNMAHASLLSSNPDKIRIV